MHARLTMALLLSLCGCVAHENPSKSGLGDSELRPIWTVDLTTAETSADLDDIFIERDRVLTVQANDASVMAFDRSSGRKVWEKRTRGAGPGEFLSPRQLFGFGEGLVGVVDNRQGRITVLKTDGNVDRILGGERTAGDLTNVCGTYDGHLLAVRLPLFEIIRINDEPEAQSLFRLNWPTPIFNESPMLQQGLFAKDHAGRCVVYQPRGDFFFELLADSLSAGQFRTYAQSYPPQKIDRTKQFPRVSPGGIAAAYAVVKHDTVFVLRGGINKSDEGVVDAYLLATGQRVSQFQLPTTTYKFDMLDDHVLVLETSDEGSILRLYAR